MPAYGVSANGQSEWNYSFIKALKDAAPPPITILQLFQTHDFNKYKLIFHHNFFCISSEASVLTADTFFFFYL